MSDCPQTTEAICQALTPAQITINPTWPFLVCSAATLDRLKESGADLPPAGRVFACDTDAQARRIADLIAASGQRVWLVVE